MTEQEINETAHHEAGHFLVAAHFKIPSSPEVTPQGHYSPGSDVRHAGVCHLENPVTPWQACVIGWAGVIGQALAGLSFPWMPPFKPTSRTLRDWHCMMMFQLGEMSVSDRNMIQGCYRRSWPACKLAYQILRRDMPRLKRMAGYIAAPCLKKISEVSEPPDPKAPWLARAQLLEAYLKGRPADDPDRPKLTEILAYLKRGEQPPDELFRRRSHPGNELAILKPASLPC